MKYTFVGIGKKDYFVQRRIHNKLDESEAEIALWILAMVLVLFGLESRTFIV